MVHGCYSLPPDIPLVSASVSQFEHTLVLQIGYGDFSPNDQLTRAVATFLVPLSTISMAILIGRLAEFQVRQRELRKRSEELERGFNREDLMRMDENKDGRVSKKEFMCFMLISSGKTTREYLNRLEKLFKELDDDGSGYLDENDLLTRIDRSNEEMSQQAGGQRRPAYRPARRPRPRQISGPPETAARGGSGEGWRSERPRRDDSANRRRFDPPREPQDCGHARHGGGRRNAPGEKYLEPAHHRHRRSVGQRQRNRGDRGRKRSSSRRREGSPERRRRHSRH